MLRFATRSERLRVALDVVCVLRALRLLPGGRPGLRAEFVVTGVALLLGVFFVVRVLALASAVS